MVDSEDTSGEKKRNIEKRIDPDKPKEKPVHDRENDKFSPGEPDDYDADSFSTD